MHESKAGQRVPFVASFLLCLKAATEIIQSRIDRPRDGILGWTTVIAYTLLHALRGENRQAERLFFRPGLQAAPQKDIHLQASSQDGELIGEIVRGANPALLLDEIRSQSGFAEVRA